MQRAAAIIGSAIFLVIAPGMQHSCESDHAAAACSQVGYYYDRGFGVPANRDLAVRFYRQALQYDASNSLARTRLTQLGAGP